MKILQTTKRLSKKGFTLIEMIGVLAVIGILAALLIPKIFEAINNSRINSAAVSINSMKSALADHYAKFGTLASSNGVSILSPMTNFDQILVAEGYMDKPLSLKIAAPTNTTVYLVDLTGVVTGTAVTANAAPLATTPAHWLFDLADTNAVNSVTGTAVAAVVLSNVLEADAKALNDIIDGPSLGVALGSSPDLSGRVKYSANAGGYVTMTIYVTHR